ncbi:winged helix-turn-helix transcriptional regulator [Acinetobacter puyangensis]|uniref:winged helix-turn-helix transcriptional regulator n=1 Tax=Acinetobacter puyangensis TaxID=1096779 RepID=UPI003A4E3A5B
MKSDEIGQQPCSIARTLAIIGDRWTAMIIRNAFLGIRRFEDLQRNLGVTRHILADRLKNLVAEGIFVKVPYTDTQKRYEYRLTEKGLDLYPIIMSMMKWGDTWVDEGLGAPVEYTHKLCDHKFTPVLVCSECGEPIRAKDVQPSPGPGFYAYYVKKNQQA